MRFGSGVVVVLGVVVTLAGQGCMGRYALDRKPVRQLSEAEQRARGRVAYDRARERVREVKKGMSAPEVQVAMGAVIAVEEEPKGNGNGQRKLMDGFLCKVDPAPLKERWLFGYDEGNVQLVGFAVEFERQDADDDNWSVRRVDAAPSDECPIVGDTQLE